MYQMIDGVPNAFGQIGEILEDVDGDGSTLVLLGLLLAAFALGSGIWLTHSLVRYYSGRLPVPTPNFAKA
jgi:hypothetical protein